MQVLFFLLGCLVQQYVVNGQMTMGRTTADADMDMNMMSSISEVDDYDDDHMHMGGDDHDDHHHHHHDHEEDDKFVPHCDCVLSSPIDCANTDVLDSAMTVLLDTSDDCLNKCDGLSVCSNAYWTLHVYHELCHGSIGAEAGALYHDFALFCTECFVELSEE